MKFSTKEYLDFFLLLHTFKREDFLEIDQSETRIACGGQLTDRDEMSILHRGHSIDDSYQVLVHLVSE